MEERMDTTSGAEAYLKRPYTRLVVPEEDGTYRGEVLEFPGCFATGDTPAEAYAELEATAADWLRAAMERGQPIPEPFENAEFSGRFVLRLPRSLHKKSARLAERDNVSLNQFIVAALAEYVGERAMEHGGFTMNVSNVNAQIYNFPPGTGFLRHAANPLGLVEMARGLMSGSSYAAVPGFAGIMNQAKV